MFVYSTIGSLFTCVEEARFVTLPFIVIWCFISPLLRLVLLDGRSFCVTVYSGDAFSENSILRVVCQVDSSSIVRLDSLLGGMVRTKSFHFAIPDDRHLISFTHSSQSHAEKNRSIGRPHLSISFRHLHTSTQSSANSPINLLLSDYNSNDVRSITIKKGGG